VSVNLERVIFGHLEAAPGETATAADIAAGFQWPEASIRRKLRELERIGYVTREGDRYTLSHDLD
jgi:DNA-binding IclR family transcriptional regulator